MPNIDGLRAELDQLEDTRLAYVMARSKVNTDAQGYADAGIHKNTFYKWDAKEREKLNELAQCIKRATAARALMILQDAVAEAATVKARGLQSRDERIKQGASTDILDRVLGKATSPFEISGKNGDPLKVIVEYADQTNPPSIPSEPAGDPQ